MGQSVVTLLCRRREMSIVLTLHVHAKSIVTFQRGKPVCLKQSEDRRCAPHGLEPKKRHNRDHNDIASSHNHLPGSSAFINLSKTPNLVADTDCLPQNFSNYSSGPAIPLLNTKPQPTTARVGDYGGLNHPSSFTINRHTITISRITSDYPRTNFDLYSYRHRLERSWSIVLKKC